MSTFFLRDSKDKILLLGSGILMILFLAFVLMQFEINRRTKELTGGGEKQVDTGGSGTKGNKGLVKEERIREGPMEIVNSAGVVRKAEIDLSEPLKKKVFDLIETTLKEAGYSLIFLNRSSVTAEFDPKGATADQFYQCDCGRYKFTLDKTKKVITVYYLVENPQADCSTLQAIRPVLVAISEMKKGREWWSNGLLKISREGGKQPAVEDMPITIVPVE